MHTKAVISVFCVLFLRSALLAEPAVTDDEVSCRDEDGRAVDWFYLYKLPKHYNDSYNSASASASASAEGSGLRYLYLSSRQHKQWTFSQRLLNASDSMAAQTLQPLFADKELLLVLYNDEFPNGTTFLTDGHAKGVVATNGRTALWLIHSVPKFPTISEYSYPQSGTKYGQSFLCLTLNATQVPHIGTQLIYNEPNIYYARLPPSLLGKYESLERVVAKRWRQMPPYNNMLALQTLAGVEFSSFAKSSKYGRDLYADWLAPTLDVDLFVEAWRNGAGNMASNCSSNDKVYNIASLYQRQLRVAFKTTSDHSKWAVTQTKRSFKLWRWLFGAADWICVGDINRQLHQLVRGGGTVCQQNSQIAQLYRDLVQRYDACA